MSKEKDKNLDDDNRRSDSDRRNLTKSVSFPYKTKEGLVILKDRRKTPDRRINNISVEENEIDEKEFLEALRNYNKFV